MQLKVLRSFADAKYSSGFSVGQILTVEDKAEARALIASGCVKPVLDDIETATAAKKGK
jgi:hypothetical protein